MISVFSGLKVNWSKSSILQLDTRASTLADHSLPLKWVSSITYLGVKITADSADYVTLNLLPLLSFFKQRAQFIHMGPQTTTHRT